ASFARFQSSITTDVNYSYPLRGGVQGRAAGAERSESRGRSSQVLCSQLVHSLSPHARPAVLDLAQVLARGPVELLGAANPARSPRRVRPDEGPQPDCFLGGG